MVVNRNFLKRNFKSNIYQNKQKLQNYRIAGSQENKLDVNCNKLMKGQPRTIEMTTKKPAERNFAKLMKKKCQCLKNR